VRNRSAADLPRLRGRLARREVRPLASSPSLLAPSAPGPAARQLAPESQHTSPASRMPASVAPLHPPSSIAGSPSSSPLSLPSPTSAGVPHKHAMPTPAVPGAHAMRVAAPQDALPAPPRAQAHHAPAPFFSFTQGVLLGQASMCVPSSLSKCRAASWRPGALADPQPRPAGSSSRRSSSSTSCSRTRTRPSGQGRSVNGCGRRRGARWARKRTRRAARGGEVRGTARAARAERPRCAPLLTRGTMSGRRAR